MKINRIKKLNTGKYQIELEDKNKIITYDEVILKYNLLYKKELDSNDINEINKMNEYYSVYTSLIKYLTKKLHSKKETLKYMEKYCLDEKDKNKLIKTLEDNKLIDDNNFIKAYISDRFYLSSDGPYKIKKDLLQHDILETDIDNELFKISEEEINSKLIKIINKKIKTKTGSNYMIKQKINQDLILLGYSKEQINACFDEELLNDSNSLEKDYNKYYNACLKKNYDSNELYMKIRQKLYQKGYNLNEIDDFINKKNSNI